VCKKSTYQVVSAQGIPFIFRERVMAFSDRLGPSENPINCPYPAIDTSSSTFFSHAWLGRSFSRALSAEMSPAQ
jgi:hypothetical protein